MEVLRGKIDKFCDKKGFNFKFDGLWDVYVNKFLNGSYIGFTYRIVIYKYRFALKKLYKELYDENGNLYEKTSNA